MNGVLTMWYPRFIALRFQEKLLNKQKRCRFILVSLGEQNCAVNVLVSEMMDVDGAPDKFRKSLSSEAIQKKIRFATFPICEQMRRSAAINNSEARRLAELKPNEPCSS